MKKMGVFASVAFALMAGHAVAADLPVNPARAYPPPPVFVFQWTGCYIGANAGYGWGKSELDHRPTGAWVNAPLDIPFLATNGSPTLSYGGVEAGGHVGCNYQIGSFVAGVEADAEYLGLTNSTSFGGPTGVATTGLYTQEIRARWLSTVRGRVGGAFDRTFLYVTGGVAFGQIGINQSIFFNGTGSTAQGSSDATNAGWVLGLGAENALTNNWLLRAEYLYADLGRVTTTLYNATFPAWTHEVTSRNRVSIVRVGISYKFGAPNYPSYADWNN